MYTGKCVFGWLDQNLLIAQSRLSASLQVVHPIIPRAGPELGAERTERAGYRGIMTLSPKQLYLYVSFFSVKTMS